MEARIKAIEIKIRWVGGNVQALEEYLKKETEILLNEIKTVLAITISTLVMVILIYTDVFLANHQYKEILDRIISYMN